MKILCLGEVLVDMLGQGSTAKEGKAPVMEPFQPYAGGAPANVAVAVAQLGGTSSMVSKVGNDPFGCFLKAMLEHYKVNTDYVWTSERGNTALAFVNLDEQGERSFNFYVENAAHKHISSQDLLAIDCNQETILHFCSGSLSCNDLLKSTEFILSKAQENAMMVCLDINYRFAFWDDQQSAPEYIDRAAKRTSIIKASREELDALYGKDKVEDTVKGWLKSGVKVVLITDGGEPIQYKTEMFEGTLASPKVSVKDTTAAGDAFIGGFLYFVANACNNTVEFSKWSQRQHNVAQATEFAIRCGAYAVTQYGAFSALPSYEDVAASR